MILSEVEKVVELTLPFLFPLPLGAGHPTGHPKNNVTVIILYC